jgi:hypothetical protein
MPNRYATVSGNWSDVTIWDNYLSLGYPTASDTVRPNGFNVTIDQNILITQLTNNASPPSVAGGRFFLNNGTTITASSSTTLLLSQFAYGNTGGNSTGSMVVISGSNNATIIGNVSNTGAGNFHFVILKQDLSNLSITGSLFSAGGSAYQTPIIDYSAGNTYISGSLFGGIASNFNAAIRIFNSSSVYIVGDVVGSGRSNGAGINVEGGTTGSIEVYGNVRGGTGGPGISVATRRDVKVVGNIIAGTGGSARGIDLPGANSNLQITGSVIANALPGIQANSGANVSIYISGSVVGGPTNTIGAVYKTTTGILQIIGPITAGQVSPGVATNTSPSPIYLTGPFYNTNNRNAVYAPIIQLISGSTPTWTFDTETFGEQRTLYTADFPGNFPSASNVRQGTVFGDTGQFTGVVAIPSASNVLKGVLLDNTTGSASFTTQNVWSVLTSSLNVTESIGERLQNASTVATDGILITSKGTL